MSYNVGPRHPASVPATAHPSEQQERPQKPSFAERLRTKRGWKSPTNPNYTIDSTYLEHEKNNPYGYTSNGLIFTIRLFQLLAGFVVIGACATEASYHEVNTYSFVTGIAVFAAFPSIYSIIGIFYRHIWKWWFAATETLWLVGWIVALVMAYPKPVENRLLILESIGCCLLLWTETFMLVVFFPSAVKLYGTVSNPSFEPGLRFAPKNRDPEDPRALGNEASLRQAEPRSQRVARNRMTELPRPGTMPQYAPSASGYGDRPPSYPGTQTSGRSAGRTRTYNE